MDTSISIYTAIYRDDLETMKWHLAQPNNHVLGAKILIFAAQCGSEKCFNYIYPKEIGSGYECPSLIRHAVNGGNVNIMESLRERRAVYVWDAAALRSAVLGKTAINEWLLENKLISEKHMNEFIAIKDSVKVNAITNDKDLHIHRPRVIRDAWEMENDEYNQFIQWLPREVIDDIENLWINELCNSGM